MASTVNSDSKEDSKLVRCDNCRQDILASKMFLHEGFCHRNNIYCDHCKKVFLKKDYENHFKINTNKKEKKERKSQKLQNNKQKEIENLNVYRSPIITKRRTTFEYIEMPTTEEFKINNPIIISEDGKILSNKNNNEYLLPYFGINSAEKSNDNNQINKDLFGNEFIFNQTDLFKENSINNNSNNFKEIDFVNNMKYSASMTNIIPNNNLYNDYLLFKYNKEQIKQDNNKYIDDQINNNINNDIKYLRKNNSSLLNSISLTEGNIFPDNNISNDNVNNSNINNNENKQNNNIIINNNIITYNSSNNIKKINKINNNKDKDFIINVPKDKRSTSFNPLRKTNKEEMKKYNIKLKKNIKHNDSTSNTKEPIDRDGKPMIENKRITSYILEKKPKNNKNNKIRKKVENKLYKKDTKIKKCEFCGSEVEDLIVHYQYYHLNKNDQIFVPKKRDTALLNEKLNSTYIDEGGLDEKNKKILLREFKPNLHNKIYLDNSNNNINDISKEIKSDIKSEKKFSKPEKIEKLNFNRILSTKNVKYENKNIPKDSKRKMNSPKSQERDFLHKKFIEINNEHLIKSEDKSASKNYNGLNIIGSPQITSAHYNYSNGIFSPIIFYSDKCNDYFTEGMFKSPNNSYFNNFELERNSFENNDYFNI